MNLTEILDEAFSLYRRHFALVLSIALVPYVLVYALYGLMEGVASSNVQPGDFGAAFGIIGAGMLGFVVIAIAEEISGAAMCGAISEFILGRQPTVSGSYSRVFARLPAFAGYIILKSLILGAGMVLCCIGFVIFKSFLLVSVCAFVIEGRSATDSLNRSWTLTAGNGWRAFCLLFVVGIISNILVGGISLTLFAAKDVLPGFSDPNQNGLSTLGHFVNGLLEGLGAALVAPLMNAVTTVFYYDLRVRKEAFDLQVLAENLVTAG